jgi:hypothetical protein
LYTARGRGVPAKSPYRQLVARSSLRFRERLTFPEPSAFIT